MNESGVSGRTAGGGKKKKKKKKGGKKMERKASPEAPLTPKIEE